MDDHFFANYNQAAFSWLRQAYTPQTFHSCVKLADRLGAVVSLSTQNTLGFRFRPGLAGRSYNTFLWPDPAL